MSSKLPRLNSGIGREILVVFAVTVVGAILRLWAPSRLGLVHFDEGIYALAGLWVFSPRGLHDFDPTGIAYAPPGFPVLEGVSYLGLGAGDFSAILVSIVAGILTIPATAWVARRSFGAGAGGAAAAFAALSGPHIAFSRMALTDASFLFFWVLAIGQGQRFLERPNPSRALGLGLAVGFAQLFKYNGWISGAVVAATAALCVVVHPSEWRSRRTPATWSWGLVAAAVAAAVYWPWFQFVESHGGYDALLAHQRGFLGGFSSWTGHLRVQLAQAAAPSGGSVWLACGGFAAALGMSVSAGDFGALRGFLPRAFALVIFLTLLCLWFLPNFVWLYVLVWTCFTLAGRFSFATKATSMLGMGWALLAVLTPFYRPYARLWLPLEAFKWLVLGGLFVWIRSACEVAGRGAAPGRKRSADPLPYIALVCVLGAAIQTVALGRSDKGRLPGLLDPSDSLRWACRSILSELPGNVDNLRAYVRPPVAFYLALAGRIAVERHGELARMLEQGDQTSWAVVDMAMIRQSEVAAGDLERLRTKWVLVRDIPTTLNLPALLDIDPSAANAISIDASAKSSAAAPETDGRCRMTPEPPVSLWPDPNALGTVTDLYELTMMAGYLSSGMAGRGATFELFVRKMPAARAYLVFAGLEQAIGDLLRLAFAPEQIDAIRGWSVFRHLDSSVMEALASVRFEGDVWSVPEGTVVFPGETLVRVTAPLPQAQWVETLLLTSLSHPTLVASKAARVVAAAGGRSLFEYGARPAHGPMAGMLAARSAFIAGFTGTSLVEAARRLGIPAVGTMAHSWVQSFRTETAAFEAYARVFAGDTTLLVDTYDTLDGVRHAAQIEPPIQAIRIDSGDVGALARQSRSILDQCGRTAVKILASGDLDEYQIARLIASGAPIDGFGVGTELATSRDAPALAVVYKLVELEGEGKFKLSAGKETYPFAKQVFRRRDAEGRFRGDHVVRADETADGEPLLVPVLRSGQLVTRLPSLEGIRRHCRGQLEALPQRLLRLDAQPDYPVTYGERLSDEASRLMTR